MKASLALEELKGFGKKSRVSDLARFYKTGPGEYAEGDVQRVPRSPVEPALQRGKCCVHAGRRHRVAADV